MFRDTGLRETMDQLFTDNWQNALTGLLTVKLKKKKPLYDCCLMKQYSWVFSDYAANLGVSAPHKKAVSQFENDNAANTQWCF